MLQKKKKSKSGKQVEMVAEPDDVGAATAKDTIEQPPEEPEDSTPRTFESLGLSQALSSTEKPCDTPTDSLTLILKKFKIGLAFIFSDFLAVIFVTIGKSFAV